jgi:putative membrane protein
MTESRAFAPGQWQRLSPWAIAHFAQRAIAQYLQALLVGGFAAYLGSSRMRSTELPWMVPLAFLALVLIGSTIAYVFFRYRVVDDAIQVRRGALFKQHLNMAFARIQNINIEHPFYFRPFALVTLKIDGAGSKGDEVNIPALDLEKARALSDFIRRQKQLGGQPPRPVEADAAAVPEAENEVPFYSRSLPDLVLHGLTNNRAFLAVAAILGFLAQSGLSPLEMARALGIDFDFVFAGLSVVRFAVLAVLSFITAIGVIALLSVVVSIFSYYGFTLFRTGDGLTIRRGLLTKHEIHIRKSRIQAIHLRQDGLDRLLGRCNVILERITHLPAQGDPTAALSRRIVVPSVRISEVALVTDEILPGCRPAQLAFTPISLRYFVKQAVIVSVFYGVILGVLQALPDTPGWLVAALLVLWPLHVLAAFLRWKAGGLAVDGEVVIARSGLIGIDYRLFAAHKVQDVTHVQSLLMRRHNLSSLQVRTASTVIRVPHLPTAVVRKVVNYCAYHVESTARSWM